MTIQYRNLMKEYEITLESDVLNPSFVSKAKDFEAKIKKNELTDDEIAVQDNELVEMFNTMHNFAEEDSEDVKKIKRDSEVDKISLLIASAETIQEVEAIKGKHGKDYPEIIPVCDKKIKKYQDAEQARQQNENNDIIRKGTIEINNAKYEELRAMGEKYKDYPDLVKLVNERHENEKPEKKDEELATKLRAKKQWSYAALRELGINPTGNDMTVAGVRLDKEYLFAVYSVHR